ncbi:hypothetical protein CDL12_08062 [Handroanthus impetiginosus]|uniref:NAB domain-containing protein n=1 Tax=Handroanthus impetiginosus TaxID=429701 RepID=A0A2G9HP21_9LAMI|nr:hypothetical protein CDL12_08062 [Handroanthus impetiginosus]
MEEKVQSMLKLIEEDGDSFAKRAEMYYKRRPELINSVEEAYKAFRALADRYDLLSKELQNANHTIATVCPEQVQFAISEQDEDDYSTPTPPPPEVVRMNMANVPKVPKAPNKDLKRIINTASKQRKVKNKLSSSKAKNPNVTKSGLTKDEALEEINKLQKDTLALQTVKEFVKSSYESGLAKYWGIENQIMEMQQKVSKLQDEFNMDTVIEDDEARTLMAQAALKSCQETLAMLQEKQEKSTRQAREEYKRIDAACQRLQWLRQKYLIDEEQNATDELQISRKDDVDDVAEDLIKETKEIEDFPEENKESFDDLSSVASLKVTQLAEKIDQLVNKVISLETAVSTQTVLVNTLRTETDDLNAQIRNLEQEKDNLVDDTHKISTRVKEMEEKLNKIQDLNKNVESQNNNLQTNFAQARSNLDHLSEKLTRVKPNEEPEQSDLSNHEVTLPYQVELHKQLKEEKDVLSRANSGRSLSASRTEDLEDVKEVEIDIPSLPKQEEDREGIRESDIPSLPKQEEDREGIRESGTLLDQKLKEEVLENHSGDLVNAEPQENIDKDEELNWQQMLLSGMEDREKILLKEYTTILRNYKDIKKKLSDKEKKEKDTQFDITLQMRELKKGILKRDEEIRYLHQRLNLVEGDKDMKEDSSPISNSLVDRGVKSEAGNENLDVKQRVSNTNEDDDEIKLIFIDRCPSISKVEEKLRMSIDAILDENLDFWLRFSTAYHQIQKFKTEVQDLQDEISKLKEKKKPDGSVTMQMKSEIRPIYKHLREIQTELSVWLEQSVSLKDELKGRFASLCSIQEEITKALKEGVEEDEIKFSSHQAAKFQGEILNMKQENNKVREELQAGLDHVRILQLEIEKTLRKLNEEFSISSEQTDTFSRPRVPLRSFIFGTKPKKQKNSIFSCMHPNRRYQVLRAGIRLANH